jgi:hypothetical protein
MHSNSTWDYQSKDPSLISSSHSTSASSAFSPSPTRVTFGQGNIYYSNGNNNNTANNTGSSNSYGLQPNSSPSHPGRSRSPIYPPSSSFIPNGRFLDHSSSLEHPSQMINSKPPSSPSPSSLGRAQERQQGSGSSASLIGDEEEYSIQKEEGRRVWESVPNSGTVGGGFTGPGGLGGTPTRTTTMGGGGMGMGGIGLNGYAGAGRREDRNHGRFNTVGSLPLGPGNGNGNAFGSYADGSNSAQINQMRDKLNPNPALTLNLNPHTSMSSVGNSTGPLPPQPLPHPSSNPNTAFNSNPLNPNINNLSLGLNAGGQGTDRPMSAMSQKFSLGQGQGQGQGVNGVTGGQGQGVAGITDASGRMEGQALIVSILLKHYKMA